MSLFEGESVRPGALDELGAAPCDTCDQARRCKAFRLACRDYRAFFDKGVNQKTLRRPNRETYQLIFTEDQDEHRG